MKSESDPEGWLARDLMKLIRHHELSSELHEVVLELAIAEMKSAQNHGSPWPVGKKPEESARDFIVKVSGVEDDKDKSTQDNKNKKNPYDGLRDIKNKWGLRREFRKFLASTENKSEHKVWRQTSESLTKLAREGRIYRLDDDTKEANHNNAVYSSYPGQEDMHMATLDELMLIDITLYTKDEIKALKKRDQRLNEQSRFAEGENKTGNIPSLITAGKCEDLICQILDTAQCPCRLADIRKVICSKLGLIKFVPPPRGKEWGVKDSHHEEWHDELIDRKVDACAKWIRGFSYGPEIFFDYKIRGLILGEKIHLAHIGDGKRVSEQKKDLEKGLKEILPECFESDCDPINAWKLLRGILSRLVKHFPDRADILSFLPFEP